MFLIGVCLFLIIGVTSAPTRPPLFDLEPSIHCRGYGESTRGMQSMRRNSSTAPHSAAPDSHCSATGSFVTYLDIRGMPLLCSWVDRRCLPARCSTAQSPAPTRSDVLYSWACHHEAVARRSRVMGKARKMGTIGLSPPTQRFTRRGRRPGMRCLHWGIHFHWHSMPQSYTSSSAM